MHVAEGCNVMERGDNQEHPPTGSQESLSYWEKFKLPSGKCLYIAGIMLLWFWIDSNFVLGKLFHIDGPFFITVLMMCIVCLVGTCYRYDALDYSLAQKVKDANLVDDDFGV